MGNDPDQRLADLKRPNFEEIQFETAELLDCPLKEDLELKQLIKVYKKVLRMVESAIADRDEAAQNLRGE